MARYPNYNYALLMLAAFLAVWALSAIGAHSPENWLAESKVFYWTIPVTVFLVARVRLSKASLTLLALYLSLHAIGMHYNYGEVPFGDLLGRILGIDRNMYDRFVHFSFGLLLAYPLREVFLRLKKTRGYFNYLLPVMFVAGLSAVYEIMEWRTVSGLSTHVGYLFIGGNDPFDGQKDMTVAIIGSLITMVVVLAANMIQARRLSKSALRIE